GVGKSTIGALLAKQLEVPFFDGDDYHSEANISKMSKGTPLTDLDRHDWLLALNALATQQLKTNSCIIACSALKESYRTILETAIEASTKWIFLHGTFQQIKERLQHRNHHFMTSDLLQSQFDTLEIPQNALQIDIHLSPKEMVTEIQKSLPIKTQFGLIGLGVMGKSLSRNLAQKGVRISMYNRHVPEIEEDIAINFKKEFKELASALPFDVLPDFVKSLETPKKIMLMVNSGSAIDAVIENLLPFLSQGDSIIDGGNSNYNKTKERFDFLKSKGIHFIGAGVSGGEEGALKGPSIMPGGDTKAYQQVQPFLELIAAKDKNGTPCCSYIGNEGSGHFVKMIHNGIEYVEMQLLADVCTVLKAKGNTPDQIAEIFEQWKPTTNSYLLEITSTILRKKEGDDWLVNKIMDTAGNKGTGNWATIATAELGVPSTLIASALFARYTSFYKAERVAASKQFNSENITAPKISIEDLHNAYQFARIINHYQGFKLIQEASEHFKWALNLSELARIWTNGCIIRSDYMIELVTIFKTTNNLFAHENTIQALKTRKSAIKKVVSECVLSELPIPSLSNAIHFFNNITTANSSANLIQAQRDYFGAHTYQRKEDDTGQFYHTDWKPNEPKKPTAHGNTSN
ncbi:NADP-dependent phosphogluconate dehydrogenase, partial [Polaribacter sp.]|nr:NADP-dependent phosphogluconate dehydrogenase [Polaribacter sp.]